MVRFAQLSPMVRKLFVWALLVQMPFSGMRVICLDPPVDAGTSAGQAHDASDCNSLCAVHRPSGASDSNCALTAAASSLIVVASTVVIPIQEPVQAPIVVTDAGSEVPQLYVEPGLAHLSPPPKA